MSPPRREGLDEDDVRVRAGRGSRPRTRRRPAHAEAIEAFVAGVDRGRYRCVIGDQVITAMKARELGRGNIVVGDTVSLAGDVSGAPGTLARVVRIERRHSVLRRSADDTDPVERVIVANADQLLIVTALADPEPRLRLIDRFLVAAYNAGIEPVLCLTKADLAGPEAILPIYEPLGLRSIVLGRPVAADVLASLHDLLAGKISVLVGQSGVGKSTLVNMLIPDADRAVGTVSPVTGRGRHTSSSAVALRLAGLAPESAGGSAAGSAGGPAPGAENGSDAGSEADSGQGWLIDTPGLRSFGLGHMTLEDIVAAFPDLLDFTAKCPPGCTHDEADCVLDAAVGTNGPLIARLDSLRRLLRVVGGGEGADPD